jgi:hypothetical protein
MASWCYDYEYARNCCSPAVWSSLYRSLTFSFGSICFGSLLQAGVRVLRYLIENARRQRDSRDDNCEGAGLLLCICDCLIKLFEDILDYFNHWAYVFCGIYGYSYLESGRMVLELFKARGWSTFVSDDLVGYVLSFTALSVGILTGVCSMFWERFIDAHLDADTQVAEAQASSPVEAEAWANADASFLFGPLPGPQYWALGYAQFRCLLSQFVYTAEKSNAPIAYHCFRIGTLIGVIVCSIMMSVVRGAVNTLIVCWADSPSRLEANHPEATQKMAEAWASVFPEAGIHTSTVPSPVGSPVYATNDGTTV